MNEQLRYSSQICTFFGGKGICLVDHCRIGSQCKGAKMTTQAEANADIQIIDRDTPVVFHDTLHVVLLLHGSISMAAPLPKR